MPSLLGFSDNSFSNHADFMKACVSLLRALKPYQSSGGARIRLPLATGTHFDDVAAQLEGFARPLWAVGALIHGDCLTNHEWRDLIDPYVRGLANGTNPNHSEYWGPVVLRDQRMVEMEIISFALLSAPDVMFHRQEPEAKRNITHWLGTINGKDFPITNWLWFRVMTNLALVKVCDIPYEEIKGSMDQDLDQMEQFYLGEGWAADGMWNNDGRQADYYSGSFAIQFSQLLYIKMAEDLDPTRCAKFRERATAFATSFWRYFDTNGAAVPFGRSLTYRFAFAGFWSAAAFAEVGLPAPVDDWGVVKGLLLRHFRWWSDKHDMFNVDGTLTIGFTYPNMYMSEDYNSPQSPYWAMKSFVALGLPETHPFWTAEEKPYPEWAVEGNVHQEDATTLATTITPGQIICNTGSHHFLLTSGQFCPWPLKATEAKYCKFAYSSHFSFSVPTASNHLAQVAPDSTLALLRSGTDIWRVPWKTGNAWFGVATLINKDEGTAEKIPTLNNIWRPWKDSDVEVSSTLIAPCSRWPDWHIRIHTFTNNTHLEALGMLAHEAGFAIQGRGAKYGETLPAFDDEGAMFNAQNIGFLQGTIQSDDGVLICSSAGASGIRPLDIRTSYATPDTIEAITGEVLKPDANTNLMWQRTVMPTIKFGVKPLARQDKAIFASGVFAIARRKGIEQEYDELDIGRRWKDVPNVYQEGAEPEDVKEWIAVHWNKRWQQGDHDRAS